MKLWKKIKKELPVTTLLVLVLSGFISPGPAAADWSYYGWQRYNCSYTYDNDKGGTTTTYYISDRYEDSDGYSCSAAPLDQWYRSTNMGIFAQTPVNGDYLYIRGGTHTNSFGSYFSSLELDGGAFFSITGNLAIKSNGYGFPSGHESIGSYGSATLVNDGGTHIVDEYMQVGGSGNGTYTQNGGTTKVGMMAVATDIAAPVFLDREME